MLDVELGALKGELNDHVYQINNSVTFSGQPIGSEEFLNYGLAKLVGMDVVDTGETIADEFIAVKEKYQQYDFFYVHIKKTDSYGEDVNYDAHSWHPNPFLLYSRYIRVDDVKHFSENEFVRGGLGRFPALEAMQLMLANALKLNKYGA